MPLPPSGGQYAIAHGEQRATVVEVGGGIREYRIGERPVLDPYPLDAICDGAHGAPLIPWPNRLGDGRYRFAGREFRLPLTEPEKGNAIHGLLRWRNWSVADHAPHRVVVRHRLHASDRWPFPLDVQIVYSLDDSGLTAQTTATNLGTRACPYACGQHPYLSPGAGQTVDGCQLELSAATQILTDPVSQLPSGRAPVSGGELDFSRPRPIGALQIDAAVTDLGRDAEGLAWVRLACPDGRTVELWADGAYPVLQLYTGDTLAVPRRRQGLAAEPMSAPPNALQTGDSVVVLEPGASHTARWGVRLR